MLFGLDGRRHISIIARAVVLSSDATGLPVRWACVGQEGIHSPAVDRVDCAQVVNGKGLAAKAL